MKTKIQEFRKARKVAVDDLSFSGIFSFNYELPQIGLTLASNQLSHFLFTHKI